MNEINRCFNIEEEEKNYLNETQTENETFTINQSFEVDFNL